MHERATTELSLHNEAPKAKYHAMRKKLYCTTFLRNLKMNLT